MDLEPQTNVTMKTKYQEAQDAFDSLRQTGFKNSVYAAFQCLPLYYIEYFVF